MVVSIDALRPEAIWEEKAAPFILNLAIKKGAYTWTAQTTSPSVTLTGHTSMLTGYDVPKHKVDGNEYYRVEGAKIQIPTIFQRAKAKGMVTVMIAGKKHFYYFEQPEYLSYHLVDSKATDERIAAYATFYISRNDFDLMFVHFANVDKAGHNYQWMSQQYLYTVGLTDQAFQAIYEALKVKGFIDHTLIIINSDHGGNEISHGDARYPENKTIPWLITGPCVQKGYQLTQQVYVWDTAATVLWALGIELPTDLDGIPVLEAFQLPEVLLTSVFTPTMTSSP